MALEQLPLDQLTTAAGVAAAAIAIRQVIEMVKGSFLPWLDAGNERKGAIILAAVLYVAWLALYGKNLGTDGPAAFAAFVACSAAALGTNEAVDAAKGVVAKNVVQTVGSDAVVASEAVKTGVISPETAAGNAAGTAAVSNAPATVDPDASTEVDDVSSAATDADGGAPLEAGPDVDLNVNGGDPLDDDEEEDGGPFDPATIGTV